MSRVDELLKQIRNLCEEVEAENIDPRHDNESFEMQTTCVLMKDIINEHFSFKKRRKA